MSFWWSGRNKGGRKILWQIDTDPVALMGIMGFLSAIVGPAIFRNPRLVVILPFLLMLLGFACLIIAKISLWKKGIWQSFGTKHMPLGFAALYRAAYFLMIIGIGMLLPLLAALASK